MGGRSPKLGQLTHGSGPVGGLGGCKGRERHESIILLGYEERAWRAGRSGISMAAVDRDDDSEHSTLGKGLLHGVLVNGAVDRNSCP